MKDIPKPIFDFNFDPEIKRIYRKVKMEIITNIQPKKKSKKPRK